jgi:hypothetical protein
MSCKVELIVLSLVLLQPTMPEQRRQELPDHVPTEWTHVHPMPISELELVGMTNTLESVTMPRAEPEAVERGSTTAMMLLVVVTRLRSATEEVKETGELREMKLRISTISW